MAMNIFKDNLMKFINGEIKYKHTFFNELNEITKLKIYKLAIALDLEIVLPSKLLKFKLIDNTKNEVK